MLDALKDCSTGISPKTFTVALQGISDVIFSIAVSGEILLGFRRVSIE